VECRTHTMQWVEKPDFNKFTLFKVEGVSCIYLSKGEGRGVILNWIYFQFLV